ncbi:nucleotidyltransferase domain-containing protein [Candidatus Bathyarchaeota archaeon]|nr:nucleotidyltransferase domain-containing protein [Candidatus Bathyarchaeota archaeon]
MSHEILVKTALKRREAFKKLDEYLETIKKTVRKLDPKAEIFMFGSVAEKKYNYSSDIDILIITRLHPANIHSELWKAGIRDPFEIHVHPPEKAAFYKKRATLVRV